MIDRTHCEYAFARGTRQRVTRQWLDSMAGRALLSFRLPVPGKIFIHLLAYQTGAENTKAALRELWLHALWLSSTDGQID